MILQEREIFTGVIYRKGQKLVSEDAARDLTDCAAAIRTLIKLLESPAPFDDERHEKWTVVEWSIARAQIALDRLRVLYCDDQIEYKRAALLRAEAVAMGIFGRRDDES